MKKLFTIRMLLFLFCAFLLGLGGCTNNDKYTNDPAFIEKSDPESENLLKDAVFHLETESWIRPINDPYTLENFQKAYEKLATKNVEGLSSFELAATHYNVRILPKTQEELRELELMEDIVVSYVPFDYAEIPDMDIKETQLPITKALHMEEEGHSVTYIIDSEEDYGQTVTYVLPVLYAVWPCEKPFPEEMDYEMLYEVFLPDYSLQTKSGGPDSDILRMLEQEALNIVDNNSGSGSKELTRLTTGLTFVSGNLTCYDDVMERNVSLVGLKVQAKKGSKTWETYTDNSGDYYLGSINSMVPIGAVITAIFSSTGWKLTHQGKSSAITKTFRTFEGNVNLYATLYEPYPLLETHRAVQYFKQGAHGLYGGWSIKIEVSQKNNVDTPDGKFRTFATSSPYILIYNPPNSKDRNFLGTVFHELGHNSMYSDKGKTRYNDTGGAIREAWANFCDYYLVDRYYESLGRAITQPQHAGDFLGNARQFWDGTVNNEYKKYTPLMIDLHDDFNQAVPNEYAQGFPNDRIKNVPATIIQKIAFNSYAHSSYKSEAKKYVGVYYTQTEFDDYMRVYTQYWP